MDACDSASAWAIVKKNSRDSKSHAKNAWAALWKRLTFSSAPGLATPLVFRGNTSTFAMCKCCRVLLVNPILNCCGVVWRRRRFGVGQNSARLSLVTWDRAKLNNTTRPYGKTAKTRGVQCRQQPSRVYRRQRGTGLARD